MEAVDFVNFDCPPQEREERARELRETAASCGLKISSLAIGADFLNGCGGDTEEEIRRVESYVDLAALLGAPRMRHDITKGLANYQSYESLVLTLAQSVREVAQYAASKGVATMTENHGLFSQDSCRVEKLYTAVNHPQLRPSVRYGELPVRRRGPCPGGGKGGALCPVCPRQRLYCKTLLQRGPRRGGLPQPGRQLPAGHYHRPWNVPVKQCLHLLKTAGFDGTIAIEFEGMEPPVDGVRIGLANLKKYWSEV